MTLDSTIFNKLDKSFKSKVEIEIRELIQVEGKDITTVQIDSSTKIITNIPHVPNINKNILSIGL